MILVHYSSHIQAATYADPLCQNLEQVKATVHLNNTERYCISNISVFKKQLIFTSLASSTNTKHVLAAFEQVISRTFKYTSDKNFVKTQSFNQYRTSVKLVNPWLIHLTIYVHLCWMRISLYLLILTKSCMCKCSLTFRPDCIGVTSKRLCQHRRITKALLDFRYAVAVDIQLSFEIIDLFTVR